MTPTHREMLKRLKSFGRNAAYFSDGTKGMMNLAAPVAEKNLREPQDMGYVCETKTGYKITEAGRTAFDAPGKARPDESNLFTRPVYVPSAWSVRDGGDQHLSIRSRGV